MSQNTTTLVRCCYFKLMACFGPCSVPSSGHRVFIRGNYTVEITKYINLKFNEISLFFTILMLFMTRLRSG